MAVIIGTTGNDFWFMGGKSLIGTDEADFIYGQAGIDHLDGGGGNDRLNGGSGFDIIMGGSGDDHVISGTGGGSLDGGSGTDLVDFFGDNSGGQFDLEAETARLGPSGTSLVMRNFENIVTGEGRDFIHGTAGDNVIDSGDGDDVVRARGGDDTLLGNKGEDYIDGGAGFDTLDYSLLLAPIRVDVPHRTVKDIRNLDIDLFDSIEKIIGSRYGDVLIAEASTELDGLKGNDVLYSGAGANKLTGGAGVDALSYLHSTAGVSVNLGTGAAGGGWAQGDTIAGFEQLVGSDYADTLTGDSEANGIDGRSGNDTISGGGGADTLFGGAGDDRIRGGSGNDMIIGGPGADALRGGSGADVFGFGGELESLPLAGQMDVIEDFSRSQGDRIGLGTVSVHTLDFIGTAAFSAENQVRFRQSSGDTIVEVNTTDDNGPEMAMQLTGTINLQASDFIL